MVIFFLFFMCTGPVYMYRRFTFIMNIKRHRIKWNILNKMKIICWGKDSIHFESQIQVMKINLQYDFYSYYRYRTGHSGKTVENIGWIKKKPMDMDGKIIRSFVNLQQPKTKVYNNKHRFILITRIRCAVWIEKKKNT